MARQSGLRPFVSGEVTVGKEYGRTFMMIKRVSQVAWDWSSKPAVPIPRCNVRFTHADIWVNLILPCYTPPLNGCASISQRAVNRICRLFSDHCLIFPQYIDVSLDWFLPLYFKVACKAGCQELLPHVIFRTRLIRRNFACC